MVLICISLTNDFKHIFMHLFASCVSSLVECLFESLPIFKIGLFVSLLGILKIKSKMSSLLYALQSVICLPILLTMSYEKHQVLIFSLIYHFLFYGACLGVLSKKSLLNRRSQRFFSSECFQTIYRFGFTFRFMVHFQLILTYAKR